MAKPKHELNVDQRHKELAEEALKRTKGNRTDAADMLGISVRTLRNWINKYNMLSSHPVPKRAKKGKK